MDNNQRRSDFNSRTLKLRTENLSIMKKLIALVLCLVAGMCIASVTSDGSARAYSLEVKVVNAKGGDVLIQIFNTSGQLVLKHEPSTPTCHIQTDTFADGVYTVKASKLTKGIDDPVIKNWARIEIKNGAPIPMTVTLRI